MSRSVVHRYEDHGDRERDRVFRTFVHCYHSVCAVQCVSPMKSPFHLPPSISAANIASAHLFRPLVSMLKYISWPSVPPYSLRHVHHRINVFTISPCHRISVHVRNPSCIIVCHHHIAHPKGFHSPFQASALLAYVHYCFGASLRTLSIHTTTCSHRSALPGSRGMAWPTPWGHNETHRSW